MQGTDRHYDHSDLPALSEEIDAPLSDEQREILEILYGEVCSTWRALLDVRFKLLGLVPFVTVAVLVVLLPDSDSAAAVEGWSAALICLLGFVVTLGLLIYETRNSELYDDLVSRGRRIEAELGVQTGIFRGRRKPKRPLVNHRTAILLIYLAALSAWACVLVMSLDL